MNFSEPYNPSELEPESLEIPDNTVSVSDVAILHIASAM